MRYLKTYKLFENKLFDDLSPWCYDILKLLVTEYVLFIEDFKQWEKFFNMPSDVYKYYDGPPEKMRILQSFQYESRSRRNLDKFIYTYFKSGHVMNDNVTDDSVDAIKRKFGTDSFHADVIYFLINSRIEGSRFNISWEDIEK